MLFDIVRKEAFGVKLADVDLFAVNNPLGFFKSDTVFVCYGGNARKSDLIAISAAYLAAKP
jgi:hypothetical protein